jgi:hypothetical protein
MTFALWRQEMKRQRQFSRRAASELDGGAGAFRTEETYDIVNGRLAGVTKRWRFGEIALRPREVLGLDPTHWPAGTLLLIVPPDWQPPVVAWYTYTEVAFMLRRSERTIQNLVSKHRLPHKTYWDARGQYRRRVTDLPPDTVRRLAELTGRGHWVIASPMERRPKARPRPAGEEDARRAVLERLRLAETLEALAGQPEPAAGAAEPS